MQRLLLQAGTVLFACLAVAACGGGGGGGVQGLVTGAPTSVERAAPPPEQIPPAEQQISAQSGQSPPPSLQPSEEQAPPREQQVIPPAEQQISAQSGQSPPPSLQPSEEQAPPREQQVIPPAEQQISAQSGQSSPPSEPETDNGEDLVEPLITAQQQQESYSPARDPSLDWDDWAHMGIPMKRADKGGSDHNHYSIAFFPDVDGRPRFLSVNYVGGEGANPVHWNRVPSSATWTFSGKAFGVVSSTSRRYPLHIARTDAVTATIRWGRQRRLGVGRDTGEVRHLHHPEWLTCWNHGGWVVSERPHANRRFTYQVYESWKQCFRSVCHGPGLGDTRIEGPRSHQGRAG